MCDHIGYMPFTFRFDEKKDAWVIEVESQSDGKPMIIERDCYAAQPIR